MELLITTDVATGVLNNIERLSNYIDASNYGLDMGLKRRMELVNESFSDMIIRAPKVTGDAYATTTIKKVIYNNPATIVLWEDGTKTVVKCGEHDNFDKEKGLAMCIVKKMMGNTGGYYKLFKEWAPEDDRKDNPKDEETIKTD